MAGCKNSYPVQGSNNPGSVLFAGAFVCDGANAPSVTVGGRFSVSAPASGVYTITLLDGPVAGAWLAMAQLGQTAVNNSARAEVRSATGLTTAGTFTIATQSSAGTDANLSSGSVSFLLFIKNTSR